MRTSKVAAVLVLLCFSFPALAQSAEVAEWNYLYRISGKGHTGFILGGGHMGFESQGTKLSACVLRAADEAEVLVTEGNVMDILVDATRAQKTLPTLAAVMVDLSVSQQAVLRSLLGKVTPEQISIMVGSQVVMGAAIGKHFGTTMSLAAGSDFPLMDRAIRAVKPIGALESSDDQVSVMQKVSVDAWRDSLSQNLALVTDTVAAKAAADARKEMMLAVKRGEEKEILRSRALAEIGWETFMIEERNSGLSERIDQMLVKQAKKKVFFAMGGAHLPGPSGIIERLRSKGYKLERACQ